MASQDEHSPRRPTRSGPASGLFPSKSAQRLQDRRALQSDQRGVLFSWVIRHTSPQNSDCKAGNWIIYLRMSWGQRWEAVQMRKQEGGWGDVGVREWIYEGSWGVSEAGWERVNRKWECVWVEWGGGVREWTNENACLWGRFGVREWTNENKIRSVWGWE